MVRRKTADDDRQEKKKTAVTFDELLERISNLHGLILLQYRIIILQPL